MGPTDATDFDAPAGDRWCFQCGAIYVATVDLCVECGVGLVEEPPLSVQDVGDVDEEQIAYEFHDWSFESRRLLDQLLTGRRVLHAWQGATMIVRATDEDVVDELVDEVEMATLPTLDPDAEHTVYEMQGWSDEQQTVLSSRLGMRGVPHEFDANGDLVVNTDDEGAVDELLDEIEQAAADGTLLDGTSSDDDDADLVGLDGLDANDLLSKVFAAADRLRRNARDSSGVIGLLDHAPTLERARTPFGFDRPEWVSVVDEVRVLRLLLEDDDSDDDIITEKAQQLRDRLFRLV